MTSFRIVTDGSCDLKSAYCAAHQITVIPLYFSVSSSVPEAYPDGRDFTAKDFYAMLRQGTPMHTSAPCIEDCKDRLRPLLAGGNDLLYTVLSAKLSGMFNVMRLAAMELQEEFPDRRIEILDSRCGSLGVGMLVEALADAREQGADLDAVCALFGKLREEMFVRFTVGDLMFLKRGGRISGGAAMVGTVLQIMPMLRTNAEGGIEPYSKVRGRKNALRTLADELGNAADPERPVMIGHCDAPEDAAFVRDILRRKFAIRNIRIDDIGPVLGVHAGPEAVAGFCFARSAKQSA